MATIKELKTTIKLRYDTLNNWISSDPLPAAGEVCIAVIPTNSPEQPDYTVGQFPNESGLTPYAIGLKVGDGSNSFNHLPWIQAIAGDVYPWAKSSTPPIARNISATYEDDTPSNVQAIINLLLNRLNNLVGSDIKVTYNNDEDSDVQTAISGIEESLGNIVVQGVDPATLGNALAQLQEQLAGQTATIFAANQEGITYKIDTLEQNGLNIAATSSPLVVADISDLIFNKQYNKTTNKAATMGDLTDLESDILSRIPSAMRFRGSSTTPITDGGVENPTINDIEITSITEGDVVLYGNAEFIWNGTAWELLGDEGSYAVKGSITRTDLAQALRDELDSKISANSFNQIAFDGDVKHLTQSDTILVFDCGNATDKLYE